MVTDNTIEGIHLHYDGQHKQYIRHNAKKYYWHIPKNLRHKGIQKDSVVLGNRRQLILVHRAIEQRQRLLFDSPRQSTSKILILV